MVAAEGAEVVPYWRRGAMAASVVNLLAVWAWNLVVPSVVSGCRDVSEFDGR